jgi:hypothetical protein
VCAAREPELDSSATDVVTLLANDAERVSIVSSNLEREGRFSGRTIAVGAIPDDARSLAIAQAVDEALRSRRDEPAPPPEPRAPPPAAAPPLPPAAEPAWAIAAALAPTLQVAPAASARTSSVVSPGAAVRLSLLRADLGGSLGVSITRASDLKLADGIAIRQLRVPADISFSLRLARGSAQAALDLGLVAALSSYEYAATGAAHTELELGGRAGLRLGWGRRIVPWLGASLEVLPHSTDFRLTPTGSVGKAPTLWLGFSLGTEVRWP